VNRTTANPSNPAGTAPPAPAPAPANEPHGLTSRVERRHGQHELRPEGPDFPRWATRLFVSKHIPELLHVVEKTRPPGRRDNTQRELGVVAHRQRSSQQRLVQQLVHGESGVGQKPRLEGRAVCVLDGKSHPLVLGGLVLHPGRVLLGQVHLGLVTCVSIGRILQGSDGARGARGTPGAWRARAAPGSTERVTTERVCGKEGHDCEWQCGKVLILCLSLKSSLWRGSGVYQPPSATKDPGRRGRRCRHASAYAGQGAGHMGAGDVSCGGWGGGRVTCAASMPPSPTPPRGRISSTSERSEPQIWR
jgi:hypothetical protein